jgi:hypothetical protein
MTSKGRRWEQSYKGALYRIFDEKEPPTGVRENGQFHPAAAPDADVDLVQEPIVGAADTTIDVPTPYKRALPSVMTPIRSGETQAHAFNSFAKDDPPAIPRLPNRRAFSTAPQVSPGASTIGPE